MKTLIKQIFSSLICLTLLAVFNSLVFAVSINSVTYTWVSQDTNYDVDKSGAINIGDKIKFTIELDNITASTNIAMIDVGTLYPNIQLYNNGTHGDAFAADQYFTVIWTVKEGVSVNNAFIKGTYWDNGVVREKFSSQYLTFDVERPVVNNMCISPNAFNPYIENCEIAYTMSETVNNVVLKVLDNFVLTNSPIKEIPKAPGDAGDNFTTWWDGRKDDGTFAVNPPDSEYYVYVSCKDMAGNSADPSLASVKISLARIEIISIDTSPNPVSPNGDGIDDKVNVNMKLLMYSWDGANKTGLSQGQMANLGFTAGIGWLGTTDGSIAKTWPYAKAGFSVYYGSGELIQAIPEQFDDDIDYDAQLAQIFKTVTGITLGDGNTGNDYDTMIPFYDDGVLGHEIDYTGSGPVAADGIFSTEYSFEIVLISGYENGIYIIKSGVGLVGINYEIRLVEFQETLHFFPVSKGGYIQSEERQTAFEVDLGSVDPTDFTAPTVSSVTPSDGSEITYRINSVDAYIEDNFGGIGVDLMNSDIYLTYENGAKVPGKKITDGANLIVWELEEPLAKKGKYIINVLPVDKRNNQPSSYLKYTFTLNVVEDDVNLITILNGGTVIDQEGRICLEAPPYSVEQDTRMSVYKPYSFPGEDTVYSGCRFIPETVSFKSPVKLIVYYSDNDKANLPAGVTEASLRIYNWVKNSWEYIGGNVNVNNMSVSVEGIRKIDGYYALLPETYGGIPTEIISDVEVDKPFKENGYISFKTCGSIKDVKLLIYNLRGSFVKELSLANGLMQKINNAGYYRVPWDVTSKNSQVLNNGVYIFRFILEKEDGAKKVVSKAIPVIK